MKIYNTQFDKVVNGVVSIGSASYQEAIDQLIPLIDKTDFQRKLQDKKFYSKLERDISEGCVMPPITIAFVTKEVDKETTNTNIEKYIEDNISKSFVLDGIQRLNTLNRVSEDSMMDPASTIYINFVFCDSTEKLLYRMITLNNGQRPMTPRHQVEIILANTIDFEDLEIAVISEKESTTRTNKVSFKKSDIIQGYLAFMAESPIIDNKKIIEEKMDELLVNRIMSKEPSSYKSSYKELMGLVSRFSTDKNALTWLKTTNNFVGFSAGAKDSVTDISKLTATEFGAHTKIFEEAFSDFNPSRIKVGKYRRELSCEFFKNFTQYKDFDSDELLEAFSEITTND
jgi:hypothetical protein